MKTRSLLRRSTAALAAALLLAACPPRALAATQQELQQQMETAKEEYEQAAEHQEQAEEQVESTKQKITSLEGQAADIQAQLSAIYDELQQAKAERDAAEGEAEAAAQLTEVAKRAYQEATAALDNFARQQNEKYSTPDLYCSLNFGPPLASGFRISCYYGAPDGIDGSHHNGTDFAAPGGTPIYAVADGVVSAARSMRSYGNCVQISHGTADDGNNYATLYAHMSSISVAEGQSVSKGQTIGYVGNTGDVVGRNGGYHLHLELRINGSRTDALSYIPY